MDIQINGYTDEWIYRLMDRQINRQTDRYNTTDTYMDGNEITKKNSE